jgi:hypothetical protein
MQLNMRNCWDCPMPFETAFGLFVVAMLCVFIGIWLRHFRKRSGYISGNILLAFAALGIFTLNHAGRNWGIVRINDQRGAYNGDAVSLFLMLIVILATAFIVHFRKPHSKS